MGPDLRGVYFDSKYFGEPSYDYVCWLDVMGTANQMLRSLPISANFVFKLHCAVLEAADEVGAAKRGIRLYPVMDGVYITSRRRSPLQEMLNQVMCRIAFTFLNERKPFHQFLARGAIAFGPVYHGTELDPRTARVLQSNTAVRDSILMGLPMAQAYQAERDAPPFGIAAHSSARAFAPEGDRPFRLMWLDWYRAARPPLDVNAMLTTLKNYFDWHSNHSNITGYDPGRIAHHRQLVAEYFTVNASTESMPSSDETTDTIAQQNAA